MGLGSLFSSSSKSSSKTSNQTTTQSQAVGDFATGNIQSTGAVTVNGLWGDDLAGFTDTIKDIVSSATSSNSSLSGKAIEQVAAGYQSAYSETTGIIQQLKPVLMIAAGVAAIYYLPKFMRSL